MKRSLSISLLTLLLAGCTLPTSLTAPLASLEGEFDGNSNAPAQVLPHPNDTVAPYASPTTLPSTVPSSVPSNVPIAPPPSGLPGPDALQNLVLPTGFISKAKLIADDGSAFTAVTSQGSANTATTAPIGALGPKPVPGGGATLSPTFNWATSAPSVVAFALPAWLSSGTTLGSETANTVDTAGADSVDLQLLRLVQSAIADFATTRDAGNFALQFAAAHHLTTSAPVGYLEAASAEPTVQNHLRILALNDTGGKWALDGYRYGGGQPVAQYLSVSMNAPAQGRVVYHDGLGGHDGAMSASLAFDLTKGVLTWDCLLDDSVDAKTPAFVSKHLVISRIPGSTDLDVSLMQATHALVAGQTSETDAVLMRVTQNGQATAIAGRQVYGTASAGFDFFRDPSGHALPFDYFASDALRRTGAVSQPAAPDDASFDRTLLPADAAAIDTAGSALFAFTASEDLATIKAFGDSAH
ncbi:MAG TPA: hypothetical protein V6D47_05100 [Oscillatoriaceae cyanobacterium]